ncbi:MAG TPA: CDP-alcohol phosphatidyltransferase family protein [Vicinamibacterales bacterium]|nr:CDP-alcohol phosphatidyltransferase family protein [Vicinamibacterales bacterium]
MHIVLMDGADVRFLGGSARRRNARVAARAGAHVGPLDSGPLSASQPAVLVPSTTALMLSLFSDVTFVDAVRGPSVVRLEGADGAFVLVGASGALAAAAADPGVFTAFPGRSVGAGTLFSLASASARRRATRNVLRATQKATDGWISRHCNRPLSRACSRAALALGMSATAASLVTLLVGLACAWLAAQPGYLPFVMTGLLFHLASVLDGVDGEIARATLTESETGARVDTAVDQLTYLACFAGLTVGWVREGSGMFALATTALIGAALVLTLVRAGRFVRAHGTDASFVLIDRAVRRAARDTGRWPLRAAAAAFTLLRRDLFAVIFLMVSLVGRRAIVPALILAGIVIANLTLTAYRPDLERAARDLAESPI